MVRVILIIERTEQR